MRQTESRGEAAVIEPVELLYELRPLPAGRMPFRRWRWELWDGSLLLATGWRMSPLHAQRAVRAYASRHVHRLHGLHPLHPDLPQAHEPEWRGRQVRVDYGELSVILTPRAAAAVE